MKVKIKICLIIIVLNNLLFSGCNKQTATIEVEEHQHDENENTVELSATQYKVAGIELGKVEQKNLSSIIKVNGVIEAPPQSLVSICAVLGGFVKSTNLLHGSRVTKGDAIVVMEHPDYIQLQQDYLESKSKLVYLELEYKRQKGLQEKNVSSAKIFQQTTADYKSMKAGVSALEEKLALIGINAGQLEKVKKSAGRLLSILRLTVTFLK